MNRRFLRWGGGIAALLVVYSATSVLYVRWALTKRTECEMPCRDLGFEVAIPGARKDSPHVYRPACKPLDLKLKLHRPQARRNSRYALWYRLTMTNVSCYRFPYFSTAEFGESWEGNDVISGLGQDGDLVIRAWGPDGNEIPRVNFKVESPRTYLYHTDMAAYQRLLARLDKSLNLDLGPGASVSSLPSTLWPRVDARRIDWTIGEVVGIYAERPLPKDAETPPEGFTILDSFVFKTPGTYTIQAVYEKTIDAEPIRPYAKRVSVISGLPIYLLKRMGLDLYPDYKPLSNHDYLMRAESERLSFVVKP